MIEKGVKSCSSLCSVACLVSRVIWADSGYDGPRFKQWVQDLLQVRLDIISYLGESIRTKGENTGDEVQEQASVSKGCARPSQAMGHRTHERLDHEPSSALPRL
jgi:hypothetical protein